MTSEEEARIFLSWLFRLDPVRLHKSLKLTEGQALPLLENPPLASSIWMGKARARIAENTDRHRFVAHVCKQLKALAGRLLFYGNPDYPHLLAEIPDPPLVLYQMGNLPVDSRPAVALVGSRYPSPAARLFIQGMARELSISGVTVVSGLARGIDTAAHQGALEGGSPTLAVMGTGLDTIYPDENTGLALRIKNQGCILTEYPPGTPPLGRNFPVRNRIISGLTMVLGVIEASDKSGSLITARMALEQNRSVLVVPGSPWDKKAQGSVRLLAQGAMPLLKAEDILDSLNISHGRESVSPSLTSPHSDEGQLMELLTLEPVHLDELLGRSGSWDSSRLALTLLNLETLGLIERLPGNYIIKKNLCANLN